jgi:hypothetical protein
MRFALPIASLLLVGALAGCSADRSTASSEPTGSSSTAAAATSTPSSATSPTPEAPTYDLLAERALEKALLTVDQLPPGYSQDPPEDDDGNRYFCDYKPPAEEKLRVRRDFTRGGGMSTELLSLSIRQYASTGEAKAAWGAMVKALETCRGEVYDGTQLTYSAMSAPKLGDGSRGVKIEAEGMTLLQNFVLVGPAMVSAGGGGLMNADADTIANLLEAQIERYENRAMN